MIIGDEGVLTTCSATEGDNYPVILKLIDGFLITRARQIWIFYIFGTYTSQPVDEMLGARI